MRRESQKRLTFVTDVSRVLSGAFSGGSVLKEHIDALMKDAGHGEQ